MERREPWRPDRHRGRQYPCRLQLLVIGLSTDALYTLSTLNSVKASSVRSRVESIECRVSNTVLFVKPPDNISRGHRTLGTGVRGLQCHVGCQLGYQRDCQIDHCEIGRELFDLFDDYGVSSTRVFALKPWLFELLDSWILGHYSVDALSIFLRCASIRPMDLILDHHYSVWT